LTTSVAFGDGSYTAASSTDTRNSTTISYTLTNSTFNNLSIVGTVFENIDALEAKLQLSTSGRYTSSN
jgi:hypothetical protein